MELQNNLIKCLDEINNGNLGWDCKLAAPANDVDIMKIQKFCKSRLGVSLPKDYINLLKIKNGVEHSGMRIFGTNEIVINGEFRISGFIPENDDYADQFDCKHVVFGGCDCDLFIYNIADKKFYRFDHINLCESYGSFGCLVEDVLGCLL